MATFKTKPTRDSYMNAQAQSTNYGSDQLVKHGAEYLGGSKTSAWRPIANFNVAPLAGRTVSAAELRRNISSAAGGGFAAAIFRCTRPADWVEAEVTWQNYKNGSAWTSGGGDFDGTTPTPKTFTEASAQGENVLTGLAAFVTDAIDNRSGVLSIIIKPDNETPGSNKSAQWRSKEYTAFLQHRWRIIVTHDGPPIGYRSARYFSRGVARGVRGTR